MKKNSSAESAIHFRHQFDPQPGWSALSALLAGVIESLGL